MFKKFGICILILVCILAQSKIVFAQEFLPEEIQPEEEVIPQEETPPEEENDLENPETENIPEETVPQEEIIPEETPSEEVPEGPETENIPEEVVIPEETIMVMLRVGESVIFQGDIELPESGTREITDSLGNVRVIDNQSVLSILDYLDTQEESFSVSKLVYYDSFGSFYLQCITVEDQAEFCDDWQYAVNTTTPWQSIDQLTVLNNDTIGIYFGKPFRLTFSSDEIIVDTPIIVTAEKYLYETDVWIPRSGITVGATLPNSENPWEPIIVSEQLVDENGQSIFSFSLPNTYSLGVKEDYYYPLYPLVVTSVPEDDDESGTGGGGGGSAPDNFDVDLALSYLKSMQSSDGSFTDSEMISDWVAVAFGALDVSGNTKDRLFEYFIKTNATSSLLTDNVRRAMAILALDENPYDFFGVDYIIPIINEFNGKQIGNISLMNDDVFALLVLAHAGYETGEDIIDNTIQFILSEQKSNGSWENSIDMTAATIQVLKSFNSQDGVSQALDVAEEYLKEKQGSFGGWESIYSTSWVAQAMGAIGEDWEKDGNSVADYFASAQQDDGAVLPQNQTLENRIWATAYAIPGVLKKPWTEILNRVSKPKAEHVVEELKEPLYTESLYEDELVENIVPEIFEVVDDYNKVLIDSKSNDKYILTQIKKEDSNKYFRTELDIATINQSALAVSSVGGSLLDTKVVFIFIVLVLLSGVILKYWATKL